VVNARRVIAMELLAAAQGIDLLRPLRSSKPVEMLHREIRKRAAYMDEDRSLSQEIESLAQMIEERTCQDLIS